jgi:hypothetical protein
MRVTSKGSEAEKRHIVTGRTVLCRILRRKKSHQGIIICSCHSTSLIIFLTLWQVIVTAAIETITTRRLA